MNLWRVISNIGIEKVTKPSHIWNIQLINRLILIASLIAVIYIPLLFWLKAYFMAIQLSCLFLFIIAFLFTPNKIKMSLAAPAIALFATYHMATVSVHIQGSQLELYIILISLIQFPVIQSRIVSFSIFGVGIVFYFLSVYFQETTETVVIMNSYQKITMIALNSLGIFIGGLYLIFQVLNSNSKYKKDLLKERARVLKRNQKIERQVEIIAESNKEIKDSINYSKRIQNAILPSTSKLTKLLPDSFILYKPKDIVAGDFYWLEKTERFTNFAVGDCTGHGVPGAMMSVICINALNRSLKEYKQVKPSDILNKTRDILLQDLDTYSTEDSIKDGMDIAFCSISGNTLNYSGANIKLYLVRNKEVIEYKPDKQPIGLYIGDQFPYTNYSIELIDGDTIYLITDGYVDQFGGEKSKKFKTPSLRKLLLEINDFPMNKQKEKMNSTIEVWRGDNEQIDDICAMGVKFNK